MTTCQICEFDYSEFVHLHCPTCGGGQPTACKRIYDVLNFRELVRAKGAESVIPHSYPLHVYAVQRRSAWAEA